MAKYFYEKRISEIAKVISIGNIVVDIPFVPNYIKAKFIDVESKRTRQNILPEQDTITWNLIWVAPNQYQLTITYNTHNSPRKLKFTIAKLSEIKGSVR